MTQAIIAEIQQHLPQEKGKVIAIVGAGGKTSLMRYLAVNLPGVVICTTSTKMFAKEAAFFDRDLIWEKGEPAMPELPAQFKNLLITNAAFESGSGRKLEGLNQEQLALLKQVSEARQVPLIIEADGAKKRALKAPEAWEPLIPEFTDLVMYVLGLAVLDKPLTEEIVFRSQLYARLTGVEIGEPVDLKSILEYLKHPSGGQKGIPAQAKQIAVFNLAGIAEPGQVDLELIWSELIGVYDNILYTEISNGKLWEVPDAGG